MKAITPSHPAVYRHYKGGLYRVLFEARNSTNGPDDGLPVVVYVSLTNGHVFVRDLAQFHEYVELDSGKVLRFTKINAQSS